MRTGKEAVDRPFNGFRVAKSLRAKALVREVLENVQSFELAHEQRRRVRKKKDQLQFERQIEAIVCDAIHLEITAPTGRIYISFKTGGRKDRYRSVVESKTLPTVIRMMDEIGFIVYRLGTNRGYRPNEGERTTLWLGQRLSGHGLGLEDLGLVNGEECIVLKGAKDSFWDEGREIQYEDDSQTILYRAQMLRINAWLESATVTYTGPCIVDTTNRRLQRIFNNGSFTQGGRLFGGFWQYMGKDDRFEIRIDGSEIVELDYGHMVPRLLYGMAGVPLEQDAYFIQGLQGYRSGVKQILNAMLHSQKPLTRFPKGTKSLLPNGMKVQQATNLIEDCHTPIMGYFYRGIGLHLFFLESQIMISVLTKLIDLGITALPIHDAILVSKCTEQMAKKTMLVSFKDLAGIDGVVSVYQTMT